MSSGCAHSVTYYISTIAPDSDQWEGFINEYYRAENALTDDDYNFVENIPENTKSKR
jgi:hypothetical protein